MDETLRYWFTVVSLWILPIAGIMVFVVGCTSQTAEKGTSVEWVYYTALSDEAKDGGWIAEDSEEYQTGEVKLGQYVLEYKVPTQVNAYDMVPIDYTLTSTSKASRNNRVIVQATAYEEPERRADKVLYDLGLPGNMNVKVEYLGHITADWDLDRWSRMTIDASEELGTFPPFERNDFRRSGVVEESDWVWFQFKITNTGDTILHSDGAGALMMNPVLQQRTLVGTYEDIAQTVNLTLRLKQTLYPGESETFWVQFYRPEYRGAYGFQKDYALLEGEYRIRLELRYRSYKTYSRFGNFWLGKTFAEYLVPITVKKEFEQVPVKDEFIVVDKDKDKTTNIYGAFEEFLMSFKMYEHKRTGILRKEALQQSDTMYVQVAPWTTEIGLKLHAANPRDMAGVYIPISVSLDNMKIEYNPDNMMTVEQDGKQVPAMFVQSMVGMRENVQMSPYVEDYIEEMLDEMIDCGINVIANTSGYWWQEDFSPTVKYPHVFGEAYKYFYDVLIRNKGLKTLGWSAYYHNGAFVQVIYNLWSKERVFIDRAPDGTLDWFSPNYPKAMASYILFLYNRWGDYWYETKDGRVIIDLEITTGWMRDDLEIRYPLTSHGLDKFQKWLYNKYEGSIASINAAWGSNYEATSGLFINPQDGQEVFHRGLRYYDMTKVFHDWSPAMEDFDRFRTELYLDIYEEILTYVREEIPNAVLNLRAEGANLPVSVEPDINRPHTCHMYYSQRRNGIMAEVLSERQGIIQGHSEYMTMPYRLDELKCAYNELMKMGITPMYLQQPHAMRDIVINDYYGKDYSVEYNTDEAVKAMMVFSRRAIFPIAKLTYEAGGMYGLMWSDYTVDAFVTETQKRELKILRQYLDQAIEEETED